MNKEAFITNVRMAAKTKGIPLGLVEKNSGVSAGYLSRIEKGNRSMTVDLAIRVCEQLGVSLNDMLNPDYFQEDVAMTADRKEFVHSLIDDAMIKRDRYVSLYFGANGIQVSVYPITEDEET